MDHIIISEHYKHMIQEPIRYIFILSFDFPNISDKKTIITSTIKIFFFSNSGNE